MSKKYKYKDLKESEWSPQFEAYMRNRLIVGAYRYGKLNEADKPKYNRVYSAIKRLEAYYRDGNTEHLVDVANLCLIEFVEGKHPKKHFRALDNNEHVKEEGNGD